MTDKDEHHRSSPPIIIVTGKPKGIKTYYPGYQQVSSKCPETASEYSASSFADEVSQQYRSLRRRMIQGSICLVLLMLILLCCGFATVAILPKHFLTLEDARKSFCLPCEDMVLDAADRREMVDLFYHTTEGVKEYCCAQNATEMHLMLKKFYERQKREDLVNRDSSHFLAEYKVSQDVASAHVIRNGFTKGETREMLTSWRDDVAETFRKNVKLKNGHLVIQIDGFYNIYSQVYFSKSLIKDYNDDSSLPVFSHSVHVTKGRGGFEDRTLMKALETQSEQRNKHIITYTSHLSGVFRLQPGDEIYLKVGDTKLVAREPYSTFFGLFRVF